MIRLHRMLCTTSGLVMGLALAAPALAQAPKPAAPAKTTAASSSDSPKATLDIFQSSETSVAGFGVDIAARVNGRSAATGIDGVGEICWNNLTNGFHHDLKILGGARVEFGRAFFDILGGINREMRQADHKTNSDFRLQPSLGARWPMGKVSVFGSIGGAFIFQSKETKKEARINLGIEVPIGK